MITPTGSKWVIVLPRYELAGQTVRKPQSPAAQKAEATQVETLHAAGIGRERSRAIVQALSTLAWTA